MYNGLRKLPTRGLKRSVYYSYYTNKDDKIQWFVISMARRRGETSAHYPFDWHSIYRLWYNNKIDGREPGTKKEEEVEEVDYKVCYCTVRNDDNHTPDTIYT